MSFTVISHALIPKPYFFWLRSYWTYLLHLGQSLGQVGVKVKYRLMLFIISRLYENGAKARQPFFFLFLFFCNNIHTRHKTVIAILLIVSSDSDWLLLIVNEKAEREEKNP